MTETPDNRRDEPYALPLRIEHDDFSGNWELLDSENVPLADCLSQPEARRLALAANHFGAAIKLLRRVNTLGKTAGTFHQDLTMILTDVTPLLAKIGAEESKP